MTTAVRAQAPQTGTEAAPETGAAAAVTGAAVTSPLGTSSAGTNPLAQAIGQLPREQREAYLLHVEGQLSVGEIAEIMESAIDTTQNALRGARLKLRELLNEPGRPMGQPT